MKLRRMLLITLIIVLLITSCTPVHRSSSSYIHYYGDTKYKKNKKIEYSKRNYEKHLREIKSGFKTNKIK